MPSSFALLLCLGFIGCLLRLDRQLSPKVSKALWFPSLWMICAASKPLVYWFHPLGSDTPSSNPFDPAFHSFLLLGGLYLLGKRRVNWAAFRRNNCAIVMLLGFMLISALWSGEVLVSVKRWVREAEAILMALLVLTDPAPRQAIESVLRRTTYVLIPLSMTVIKYFPEQGCQYGRWTGGVMWVGVTLQKNGLGRLCLIAVFYLLWSLMTRSKEKGLPGSRYRLGMDLLVLFLAFWQLKGPTVQAYSATAVTSLCLGLVTFGGLAWVQRKGLFFLRNAVVGLVLLGLMVGIALPYIKGKATGEQGPQSTEATAALGRDSSFTGRTDIWAGLMPDVQRNPILGVGLLSFWTPETIVAHDIGEAHNGYLDMMLHLGAVGVGMAGLLLLSVCRQGLRGLDIDFQWSCLVVCFVVMITFHNVSESSIHCFTCTLSGLLVFLAISLPGALVEAQQSRPERVVASAQAPATGELRDVVSAVGS